MSQYVVTDTELEAVANAIRTKGGTNADLEWPSDFVSAIGALSSGGSGNNMPYIDQIAWSAKTDTTFVITNNVSLPDANSMYLCIFAIRTQTNIASTFGCTVLYTGSAGNSGTAIKYIVGIADSNSDLSNGIGFVAGDSSGVYGQVKITRYRNVSSITKYGSVITTGISTSNGINSVEVPLDGPSIIICFNTYNNTTNDYLESWDTPDSLTFMVKQSSASSFPFWGGAKMSSEFFNFVNTGEKTIKMVPPGNTGTMTSGNFGIITLAVA